MLFLGVNPSVNKQKLKDAFKKVMAANHPDRGGSPYLASKINEAKDFLEKHTRWKYLIYCKCKTNYSENEL